MLQIKDIKEIKRRLKKNEATFTRMTGCYVNSEKEKVLTFAQSFLNLEDEEYFKYLELAKAVFAEKIDDQMLDLEFKANGQERNLQALRQSKLKNEEMLDAFYDNIIEQYYYVGNYLILVFHDAYDVLKVTTDNNKLDESEEVYEYLVCALCPVTLSEAALGYIEQKNQIGPRIRDWIVRAPRDGFIWPAFKDRSAESGSVMYFCKNAENPDHNFMEYGLGCMPILTASEERSRFEDEVWSACESDELQERYLMNINEKFDAMISEPEENRKESLDGTELLEIMINAEVPEYYAEKIRKAYVQDFEEPPKLSHIFNKRALKKCIQERKREHIVELMQQAVDVIEKEKGTEIELTKKIKDTIGQNR